VSDDLRDYCECDECKNARLQLHLHSERKRTEREALYREYEMLVYAFDPANRIARTRPFGGKP